MLKGGHWGGSCAAASRRAGPSCRRLGRTCAIPIADICSAVQHHEMANEDALKAMGQYLHQDIDIGAASPADLARNVISLMSAAERAALRKYLASALGRLSPSELKGAVNRAITD